MNAPSRQAPESSRERRRRETRSALLQAAYEKFRDVGYGSASLEAIAAEAGFTKGALYGNFSSKEELFLALAEERAESLPSEWRHIDPESLGREEVGRAVGSWLADAIRRRRGWFLASAEFSIVAARNPELAARRLAALRRTHRELGEVLLRYDRSATADPLPLGVLAMALIDGVIINAALDPDLDVASVVATGLQRLLPDGPGES
ncbi:MULTISPECIES: TetR/AcrR family transcriptional regulator [Amycolatopsis]|uniref:TetR/AcrR family transcriptional regulator n=1 Tax=Amycolatopsis dendrobii TaxID=2760662 RepID=A0A7W3ZEN6_9PSEU|nr:MULTISPECIES: TetR/AcrR family transcriptional regulator [Amycolatopsis]MBB1158129.1 TetR/AcrR family transcriptional regulator [Amycolatopsis dendrobii]UKD57081.1 TetR/AcrR family transcriptional regulator [Amycolatopsis sp. FU40]